MARLDIRALGFRNRGPYSFTVEGGQCLGLCGESGAGKSLLLRAIADLDPHQGEVLLDQIPCSRMSGPRWRRQVGLLLAESQWWQDRVADHFHDFDALDAELLACLGFERQVADWQVSRLSTGEKQRLAILRLLENRPRVLLLDEPTASLDPDNTLRVERLLRDYGRVHRAPLLWVSHDPGQLARVADQILVMDENGGLGPGEESGHGVFRPFATTFFE